MHSDTSEWYFGEAKTRSEVSERVFGITFMRSDTSEWYFGEAKTCSEVSERVFGITFTCSDAYEKLPALADILSMATELASAAIGYANG